MCVTSSIAHLSSIAWWASSIQLVSNPFCAVPSTRIHLPLSGSALKLSSRKAAEFSGFGRRRRVKTSSRRAQGALYNADSQRAKASSCFHEEWTLLRPTKADELEFLDSLEVDGMVLNRISLQTLRLTRFKSYSIAVVVTSECRLLGCALQGGTTDLPELSRKKGRARGRCGI